MENTQTNQKSMRELETGALWLKKSKAGNSFLSGYILDENKNKVNIVLFKNNYKKAGESSPDYRIYLSEQQGTKEKVSTSTQNESENSDAGSDDIPF
jgi:hypothetical protein